MLYQLSCPIALDFSCAVFFYGLKIVVYVFSSSVHVYIRRASLALLNSILRGIFLWNLKYDPIVLEDILEDG